MRRKPPRSTRSGQVTTVVLVCALLPVGLAFSRPAVACTPNQESRIASLTTTALPAGPFYVRVATMNRANPVFEPPFIDGVSSRDGEVPGTLNQGIWIPDQPLTIGEEYWATVGIETFYAERLELKPVETLPAPVLTGATIVVDESPDETVDRECPVDAELCLAQGTSCNSTDEVIERDGDCLVIYQHPTSFSRRPRVEVAASDLNPHRFDVTVTWEIDGAMQTQEVVLVEDGGTFEQIVPGPELSADAVVCATVVLVDRESAATYQVERTCEVLVNEFEPERPSTCLPPTSDNNGSSDNGSNGVVVDGAEGCAASGREHDPTLPTWLVTMIGCVILSRTRSSRPD